MNFKGYDRPWEETWYNKRSREKNPERNNQDKNLEGLIQTSFDNNYATNGHENFLEHAAHGIFSFVPAPVKKVALTVGLVGAIAACGGQGVISPKTPVPSPSPASAALPVPERRDTLPTTLTPGTPESIYTPIPESTRASAPTLEATIASSTKTPEIKIDFEKLSEPAIIPQTMSNTYDVIFFFQEPKSNLQEYVFNNTDAVTYMKFVRAENDFEYKKAMGKFVIDIFHHNIPSAFADVIDLYKEALESLELSSFYISLETFRAFHESRPYNQTMVPAEPNNLQLTQSGEKKPIDELVMDFVSYSKWNADFLLQKKKYEEESGLTSQWTMHKGPDNSGYIDADVNLPLEKAWDIEMDTSLGRPIIFGDRIYIADDDNRLNVLSAATGEKDFGMHLRYNGATPAAIEDMVIASGFLSASEARGRYSNSVLKAFDSDSGEEIWREYMFNPKTVIIDGETVYVTDSEFELQSRNIHDGRLYWHFNLDDYLGIFGTPKITDDAIYFLGIMAGQSISKIAESGPEYEVYSLSKHGNLNWKADATPDLGGYELLDDHELLYKSDGTYILAGDFLIWKNLVQRVKDDEFASREYCLEAFNLKTRSLELDDCFTLPQNRISSIVSDGKDLYVSSGNKILRYAIEADEMKEMLAINLENTILDSVLTNEYIFAATEAGITAIDRENPDTRHKIYDFEYETEIGGVSMAISGADLYVVAKPRGPEHIIKFSNPTAQQVQGELKPTPTTTATLEEGTLENIVGKLAETFPQLERSTIQHAYQITTERRTNPELRDTEFYTADSALYTVEKEGSRNEVFLYLGRGDTNPIFNNIEEATQQLIQTRNYFPPREDIEAVKSAESTLRVKLSDLKLQKSDYGFSYFEIDTANYDKLNSEQRRVAEHVYGQEENFEQNMEMLRQNGINKTEVSVLNPDYVKQNAPQDGALVRASSLHNFYFDSWFKAYIRSVVSLDGLRGVPNVAEGGAQKR